LVTAAAGSAGLASSAGLAASAGLAGSAAGAGVAAGVQAAKTMANTANRDTIANNLDFIFSLLWILFSGFYCVDLVFSNKQLLEGLTTFG
jgi:hypothetical protein